MRKPLLFLLGTVIASGALLIIGHHRGKACPEYAAKITYQLGSNETETAFIGFVQFAVTSVGPTFFRQKRWPETQSEQETINAYRHSLRYRFRKNALDVWCIGPRAEYAIDGAAFVGAWQRASEHSFPAVAENRSALQSTAERVTPLQRIAYGLGLFPDGKPIPPPR